MNRIYDRLKFNIEEFHKIIRVDVELPGRVNIIKGNSSTGKTYVADKIKDFIEDGTQYTLNKYNLSNNIIVINNSSQIGIIKDTKNKLVIIDEADTLLTDEICEYINSDLFNNNQYLIMTRAINKLVASTNSIGEFIRNKDSITTQYDRR
jgi:hypothetical protein